MDRIDMDRKKDYGYTCQTISDAGGRGTIDDYKLFVPRGSADPDTVIERPEYFLVFCFDSFGDMKP